MQRHLLREVIARQDQNDYLLFERELGSHELPDLAVCEFPHRYSQRDGADVEADLEFQST